MKKNFLLIPRAKSLRDFTRDERFKSYRFLLSVLIFSAFITSAHADQECTLTIVNNTHTPVLITHFELTLGQETGEETGMFTTPGTFLGPGHYIQAQKTESIGLRIGDWSYVYEEVREGKKNKYQFKNGVYLIKCPEKKEARTVTVRQLTHIDPKPDFISFENIQAWSAADTF